MPGPFCRVCGSYNEASALCHQCSAPLDPRPALSCFLGAIVASGRAVSEERAAIWWPQFWARFDSQSSEQRDLLGEIVSRTIVSLARLDAHVDEFSWRTEFLSSGGLDSTMRLRLHHSPSGRPLLETAARLRDVLREDGPPLGQLATQAVVLRDAFATRKVVADV